MLQYSKHEACQIVKPSGDFKVYLLKAKKLRWKVRLQVENPHDVVSVFIAIYLQECCNIAKMKHDRSSDCLKIFKSIY